MQLTQTQSSPFQEIFIDVFSIEGKLYLTSVDAFSKLGQAIEIPNKSTPEIVRALIKYFGCYSIPKRITCDSGTEFNNELLRETLTLYKIQLHISTPGNPNSLGIVERFHSTIIEIYRLAKYEKKCTDAASVMQYAIMAYNNTIHTTTGLTPFEVVFGHTDGSSIFDNEFEKNYTQQLVKDHVKRTKILYEYLTNKIKITKEKIRTTKGGEKDIKIPINKDIYIKNINTRKSKDKPRYTKAKITGKIEHNIVPVLIGDRLTRAPLKHVKRPSQVDRIADASTGNTSPATAADSKQSRDSTH